MAPGAIEKRLYGYDEPAVPEQYCPACLAEAGTCECPPQDSKWRIVFPDRKVEAKAEAPVQAVQQNQPYVVGG